MKLSTPLRQEDPKTAGVERTPRQQALNSSASCKHVGLVCCPGSDAQRSGPRWLVRVQRQMAAINYYPDGPLACPEDISGGIFSAKVSKVKGAVLLRL